MKLIIAEKPKLGSTVANALHCRKRQEGYIEGDKYIVTWGFGHLFTLKNIQDYDGLQGIKYEDISLPFFPEFEVKLKNDLPGKEGEVEKQFNVIKNLISRTDVEEIIHCGDSDREGQLIVDEILENAGNTKPVYRLWLPEQTEETIQKQINLCKKNEEYRNLHNEALAREYLDWCLGINLSVYLSLKSKVKINVGRVIIPIIKYIYDRDQEIKNFIPKKYFKIESKTEKDGVIIPLSAKKKFAREEDAKAFAEEYNKLKAKVISIDKNQVKKYPKKLFSLTKIQQELSKNHKMDFDTTLKIIQKLYEEGYVTYPRTNTEYLAENEKDKVKELIEVISNTGYELEFKDNKTIFDSSKVESHSALIPTTKLPEKLSNQEEIVYRVIFNRFVSNFLKEETIVSETVLNISVGEEMFKLKGTEIVSPGFYKYEPKSFKNQLPNLLENEEFSVNFVPVEKITTAPKKVSETELSDFLEKPFKKLLKKDENEENIEEESIEEENDLTDEDYKMLLEGIEIGTVATRTQIIEKTKDYNYILQDNSYYSITPFGEKVIQLLDDLEVNLYKEKNIEFSKDLKKVYHNLATVEEVLNSTFRTLNEIVEKNLSSSISFLETVGKCPKCGENVNEENLFYKCSSCDFKLWKKARHFESNFSINTEQAKKFLNNEEVLCELVDKDNKKTKKNLKLYLNGEYVNFEEVKETVGKCPKCGADIVEGGSNFYCSDYKKGCTFKLWCRGVNSLRILS